MSETANGQHRRSLWGSIDPIALNAVLKGMSGLVGNDAPFPTQWPRTSLNQTFDPRRSVDLSAGYPQSESGQGFGSINPDFYRNLYERECIATRVVQVLPNECWQVTPLVFETEDAERETPFEQAFDLLPQMLRGTQSWYKDTANNLFWEPCKRVDRLSGIGTFGILLLGIDDSRNLDQPADGVSTLDPTGKANPWGAGELSSGAQWGPGGAYASGEGSWPGAPDTVGDPSKGGPAPGGGFTHAASRGPKTPTNLRGTQNAALEWFVANSRKNGAKWFDVRRPSLAVNAGLTDALAKVGKKLAGMSDPGPMPGYGQVFLNKDGSSAWYVGGDGDDDGWSAVVKRELKEAGVSSVKYEAESFPPRDGSWVQCHPKKRAWVNPLANHFAASCPVNAGHHDEVPVTNVDPETGMPGPRTWKAASDATMTSVGLAMVLKTNGAVGTPAQGTAGPVGGPVSRILGSDGRPIVNDAGSYQDAGNTIQLGASAIGTDAQYVGIQLSPPEFPQTEPSKEERRLLFLRAFDESLVQIVQYEANVRNPRFGLPVMYRITLNDPREQHSGIGLPMATVRVHWSRIIHVADNRGSSEVFGVPRMRPVLNRLLDLRKLYAAGAEGYWQMAFTKLQFVTHPQLGSDVDVDAGAMMDQVEKLINDLQGYLLSRGGEWKAIAPTIIEYTNFILAQVEAICIQLGVPKRVFMGTERGELASTQDDAKWNDVLRERQDNYLTPLMIVPFVDRLIAMGVLPEPEGYSVQWPDLDSQTDKDKAQIALQRAQALGMFISQGCEAAMTLKRFFMLNYGIDDEEAEQWVEEAKESQDQNMTIPSEGESGHPATEEQSDFGGFDEDGNPVQGGPNGGEDGDDAGGADPERPGGGGDGQRDDGDDDGEDPADDDTTDNRGVDRRRPGQVLLSEDEEATENIALIAADAWADEAVVVDNEWKEELHPRDKGKFSSAEGAPSTSTKDTPFHTDDVNVAAKLLGEGRKVVLSQPRQVSTLLDKLAKIVKEAEAKGEKAPNYDLCLSGDTDVITWDGIMSLKELADRPSVKLLTRRNHGGPGAWVDAEVKSFGVQSLRKVTFSRSGIEKVVHATPEHRWFVRTGGRAKDNTREVVVSTDSLVPGKMRVVSVFQRAIVTKSASESTGVRPSPFGIMHGFVFGDGCAPTAEVCPGFVVLYGDKEQLLKHFPAGCRMTTCIEPGQMAGDVAYNVRGTKVQDIPRYFKDSPLGLDETQSYLFGWLAGYFAADGTVDERNGVASIGSARLENIKLIQTVANRLGFPTFSVRTVIRKGFGKTPQPVYDIGFQRGCLPEEFYLMEHHRKRAFFGQPEVDRSTWTVVSVEETDRVEEVYCAIVPETSCFTLADNLLTGNCNVSVNGTNLFCTESLGVPRIKMPQLRGVPEKGSQADKNAALYGGKDDKGKVTLQSTFVAELRRTVNVEDAVEDAAHLRASQNELDGAKAARMLKHARKEEEQEPIVVSRDNYIVDGHHHWAGLVAHEFEKGMKGLKVPVRRVDMGIVELLDRANKFAARMGMRSESVTGNLWSDAAREAALESRLAHARPHDEHHGHDPLEHATHQVHVAHELHEVGEAFGGGEAHHLVQEAHEAGQHALEHGVEHHVSPADAGAIVARHLYPHAVKAVESILQKGGPKAQRVAEGIHAFHEGASRISEKAVSGLQARYGKATANLILASGNLTAHTLLAPLGAAGHALPGQKFIGSIPALALAEAGKRLGLVGEGSALERSVAHVGTWVHAVKNAIGKGVSAVTKHVAGQALDIAARNQATTNEVQLSPEEIDEAAEEFAAQLREEFEALAKKHADKLGTMDEE